MVQHETVRSEVTRVLDHWAGEALFEAWCTAHDRQKVRSLLEPLHEPGPIALRCRLRHLLDPGRPEVPRGTLALGRSLWDQILVLETRGDVLLRMGPEQAPLARAAFESLMELEYVPTHRVITVNALLGLAELARQVDELDSSLDLLKEADTMSGVDGYRFGRMRALVSLGYLTVVALSSSTAATEYFAEASRIADEIGDRLFRANAELGLSECFQRLREMDRARDHATRALAVFETLKSPGGIGNAASRLADILLHTGERARAREMLQRAADAFGAAEVVIGQIGTLDLLGDVEIQDGDIASAVAHHRQAHELSVRIDYPRGKANALAGLAQAARTVKVWPQARQLGKAALTNFRQLGDPLGETNALEGLALCAVAEGDMADAVQHRFSAVRSIEAMRADLSRHNLQAEYRARFEPTYRRAASTALEANNAEALLWLMECLAGRRLAGLVERGAANLDPSRAELLGYLAAQANQSWRVPDGDAWLDRRTRVVRKLGALAIGASTAEPAAQALEDMIATLYLPPPDRLEPLTSALPEGCELLLVEIGLTEAVLWVSRDTDGQLSCGSRHIEGLDELLTQLDGPDAADLVLEDLAPLKSILPEQLTDRLRNAHDHRLLVVPIGRARSIPWTAIPVGSLVLGEQARIAVCPSLTVQRALRSRRLSRPAWPTRPAVRLWRHPRIVYHPLDRFDGLPEVELQKLPDAEAALSELRHQRCDLLALAAHGRSSASGSHYLELDERVVLTQADCIGALPPRKVVLAACWGGHAPTAAIDADPVSVAALLLATSSDEVAATTAELGDSGQATRFVEILLHALFRDDAPSAVRQAVVKILRNEHVRRGAIRHWAPMQAYGTFLDEGR